MTTEIQRQIIDLYDYLLLQFVAGFYFIRPPKGQVGRSNRLRDANKSMI